MDSELQKKLLEIIIGIVGVLVFFSGLLQVLESLDESNTSLQFDDWM